MLALPAAAAEAQPLTPCPACGAGWLLEPAAVQLDRTTTEKAPCAHGDPAATDYLQTVRYQPVQACSHCGYTEVGEVYAAVETSCSLDFVPVPRRRAARLRPRTSAGTQLAAGPVRPGAAGGLTAGQFMIGEHNRTLYLVQYTPVVADYTAWGGAALTPQEYGDYTWQAGSESVAALLWSENPEMTVTARALHDFEQGAAGDVLGWTLPQANVCASYGPGWGYILYAVPFPRSRAAGRGSAERGRRGSVRPVWHRREAFMLTWYDPESGLAVELQQMRISERSAAALVVGYVQQNAESPAGLGSPGISRLRRAAGALLAAAALLAATLPAFAATAAEHIRLPQPSPRRNWINRPPGIVHCARFRAAVLCNATFFVNGSIFAGFLSQKQGAVFINKGAKPQEGGRRGFAKSLPFLLVSLPFLGCHAVQPALQYN